MANKAVSECVIDAVIQSFNPLCVRFFVCLLIWSGCSHNFECNNEGKDYLFALLRVAVF